ncbi:hypothetical protein JEZ13_09675 [bacterium]|nr:hypothetical protein [bacterium]
MNTFLLSWSPKDLNWETFDEDIDKLVNHGHLLKHWTIKLEEFKILSEEKFCWTSMNSGIIILTDLAFSLEEEWFLLLNRICDVTFMCFGNHDSRVEKMFENQYERNPYARKIRREKRGQSCSVCGINFTEIGGISCSEIMEYHQEQEDFILDDDTFGYPEDDLYPVCPNCHAMIHSRSYPYSMKELRELNAGNINCIQVEKKKKPKTR